MDRLDKLKSQLKEIKKQYKVAISTSDRLDILKRQLKEIKKEYKVAKDRADKQKKILEELKRKEDATPEEIEHAQKKFKRYKKSKGKLKILYIDGIEQTQNLADQQKKKDFLSSWSDVSDSMESDGNHSNYSDSYYSSDSTGFDDNHSNSSDSYDLSDEIHEKILEEMATEFQMFEAGFVLQIELSAPAFFGVLITLDKEGNAKNLDDDSPGEKVVNAEAVLKYYQTNLDKLPDRVVLPIPFTCGSSMTFTYQKVDGTIRTVKIVEVTGGTNEDKEAVALAYSIRSASRGLNSAPWTNSKLILYIYYMIGVALVLAIMIALCKFCHVDIPTSYMFFFSDGEKFVTVATDNSNLKTEQ